MNGSITGSTGLTDDGSLVLQLSITDAGQVNDLRCYVEGRGWLPWRALVSGATWHKPHPFTSPATLTAVFGQGCHMQRYQGRVEAKGSGMFGGWSAVASFDWTPGAATARLNTTRPAPRVTQSMRPVSGGRRKPQQDRLGRLLGWLDRLGG